MKHRILWTLVAVAVSLLAADRAREAKLQQAIDLMGTKGDLPGAIKLLEDVAKSSDRNLAARSLLYLGDCREKLGQKESRSSYERILHDFPEQKEVVAEASRRLAALVSGIRMGEQATRVLWTGPNVDGNGRISADGRYMAGTDWETGDLVLHEFSNGSERRLTNKGTWTRSGDYAEEPAISRDGKLIAYSWYVESKDRYELRVASLGGSGLVQPRTLVDREDIVWIGVGGWSRDGEWLSAAVLRKDQTREIAVVATRDGALRVLKSGMENVDAGDFSPDGRHLLYTRVVAGVPQSYVLGVDGKEESSMVTAPSSAQSPVWIPDGSRVLFVSDRGGNSGLWSVVVTNGKAQGDPELLKPDFGDAPLIGMTNDGAVFHAKFTSISDIYLAGIDPESGILTSEPKRVNTRSVGNSWGRIAWLPDGKSLSFWSRRNQRDYLVVHTLATGEERDIREHISESQDGPGYTGWFSGGRALMTWERKGKNLEFRREDRDSKAIAGNWSISAPSRPFNWITFSRDLMTMFSAQKDSAARCDYPAECPFEIVARDIESGRDREIARVTAKGVGIPSQSPDGREVAFLAGHNWGTAVIVVAAGGSPREIYRDTDKVLSMPSVEWTNDSGQVLVYSGERGREAMWSFSTKGGVPQKSLLHLRLVNLRPATVSPDGTQIALGSSDRKAEIRVTTGLSFANPAR